MQIEYVIGQLLYNDKGKTVNHCLFSAKGTWYKTAEVKSFNVKYCARSGRDCSTTTLIICI
jgi:hypothetical protein